ncbi:hypothetical protein RUND412_010300 [Rhizina undulata]
MRSQSLLALALLHTATTSSFKIPDITHVSVDLPSPPPTEFVPAGFTPAAKSATPYCNITKIVTYEDRWGPLFTEKTYSCDFPESPRSSSSSPGPAPFRAPAPFSHPAGKRYGDERVAERGSLDYDDEALHREYRAQISKHQIHDYGCTSLPNPKHLNKDKYSNLFWGLGQLWNQSCLQPNTMVEYVDVKKSWTARWRLTNVNRGDEEICDWYSELGNVAAALHYFCFHTRGLPEREERSGGFEILAHGREGGQRWCVRYSKRGMDEREFEDKCLGIEHEEEDERGFEDQFLGINDEDEDEEADEYTLIREL